MKTKICSLLTLTTIISCLLSGCRMIALPDQEPFGEHTYSEDQARSVYADVCTGMEHVDFSDWSGYSIELNETMVNHDFYRTDEYTVAWHEGSQDYLWYQGRLYCMDGEELACRDMAWEELQSDEYAAKQWDFACALLARETETLKYKYIPMSIGNQYLLTAEYPETEWDGQIRRFPRMYFRLDEDRNFIGFSLCWQEGDMRVISIDYFPYENSSNLQAERKVWSFAHELGLIEQGVPALSTQENDREWSRSMIDSIDFDSILHRAKYKNDLAFPVPPES